ncbi:MAG: hypothetical protein WAU32_17780 [Thermoanaerobaculia bacterium]
MNISRIRIRFVAAAAASVVVVFAAALAGDEKANPAWDKLKSLVGTWQGTMEGHPVSVTYTLVSNGTSLMESLTGEHDVNMITMYHPDGDSMLATHYCAAGNQPRIRAKALSDDGRKLDFQFVDATNVAGSSGEVMNRLVVTFQDPDHFTQTWTARSRGKDHTSDFVYTRKK